MLEHSNIILLSTIYLSVFIVHQISRVTIGRNANHYPAVVLVAGVITWFDSRDLTMTFLAISIGLAAHLSSVYLSKRLKLQYRES